MLNRKDRFMFKMIKVQDGIGKFKFEGCLGPPTGKYMILLMTLDLRSANNLHSNFHCIFGGGCLFGFTVMGACS